MKRKALTVAVLAAVLMVALPAGAEAGSGSTIFERFWDSLTRTLIARTHDQAPFLADLLREGEENFLAVTDDLTTHPAVQDVVRGMQYVGLLVLAFCFVLSLTELATGALLGGYHSLANWFWRLLVATVMTLGTMPIYGLAIRLFNGLVLALREWLDRHWRTVDTGSVLEHLLSPASPVPLLLVLFVVLFFVVCMALWFLMGGVRIAELAVYLILAPITWPLYLLPSVDDIPKTAFRGFLGINALLLLVVAMLRLSMRWVMATGLAGTFWNFIPAISLLGFTLFLPGVIKRVTGHGQSGVGALTTAVRMIAGMKLIGAAAAAGAAHGAAAAPPAAAATPATATAPTANSSLVAAAPGSLSTPTASAPAPQGPPPTWGPVPLLRPARLQGAPPWRQVAATAEDPNILPSRVEELPDGTLRVVPILKSLAFGEPGEKVSLPPSSPKILRFLLDDQEVGDQ